MACTKSRPRNTKEVLLSKVKMGGKDECWPWQGYIESGRYGRFQIGKKRYFAHRAIYNIFHPGEITLEAPKDLSGGGFILHSCDNPICCNPNHMRVGTMAENSKDMINRGRKWIWKSTDAPHSKLSESDVHDIRWLVRMGITQKKLCTEYGLSPGCMSELINYKSYRDF